MKNLNEDREVSRSQVIKNFMCHPKEIGFYSLNDREPASKDV